MEELKIGDVVKLKSGGPSMTVENPNWTGKVRCQWFQDGKLQIGVFPKEALEKDSGGSGFAIAYANIQSL